MFRDSDGQVTDALKRVPGDEDTVLTRFNQLELLQGARDEREWSVLADYLDGQDYLEAGADTWRNAARIHFDLRRCGHTVRSPIDCCIAELAREHDALLVHRDRDFVAVAEIRPVRHHWLQAGPNDPAQRAATGANARYGRLNPLES